MEALLARLSNLPSWEIYLIATELLFQGFIFTIFPEEIIITTLGLLWGQGKLQLLPALCAIWIGLLPANSATVFLGQTFGPRLLKRRPFIWMFNAEAVEESLAELRKYGKWVIIGTRFTPIIRGPIYVAAGLSRMGVFNFFKIDAFAACFQVPLLMLLGRLIGKNAESLMQGYQRIGILMLVLLVATVAYNVLMGRARKRRRARAR